MHSDNAFSKLRWFAALFTLLVPLALLYIPYIGNPIFFDDYYFFVDPQAYVTQLSFSMLLDRRWISTSTLALTYKFWGATPEIYHVQSLSIHILLAFSLFLFLRELLLNRFGRGAYLPALAAAAIFALHPVSAFAVGYIIERSILLAGLFSVWMWIAVHRGITGKNRAWLLSSALFFYLAVFSKEHAVTALPVALLVAWNAADGDWRKTFRQLTIPLPLWIITAAIIVLRMKGIIGSAYEPIIGEMLQGSEDQRTLDFLLRSVVNQSWLFFKYGLLWLLPIESWMSIDLREPFPTAWYSWPWAGGALAYLAYPLITAFAIWRGWMSRLAGLGLLAPWLLFLTMFSAVQYQESFVLYRSYLWAIPATLLPALLMAHLSARRQVLAITVIGFFLFGLTWSRLQTFSHPVLLWDEAVTRLEGRNEAPGAYRIYHNRGIEYLRFGDVERALADFNKTVAINPAYEFVYNDRGAAYMQRHRYDLALADFNRIILAKPDFPRPYVGRGSTLLILGRRDEGLNDLEHACSMGYGCGRYRQALADDEETKTGSKRQE